jgi:hypothetical protein
VFEDVTLDQLKAGYHQIERAESVQPNAAIGEVMRLMLKEIQQRQNKSGSSSMPDDAPKASFRGTTTSASGDVSSVGKEVNIGSRVRIVKGHNSVKGKTGKVVTRGRGKVGVQLDSNGKSIDVPYNSVELV